MKMRTNSVRPFARAASASLAAAVVIASSHAALGQTCPTTTPIVYVTGGGKVIVEKLGNVLAGAKPPVTVIYKQQGSCLALDAVVNGTKLTGAAFSYTATTAEACDLGVDGYVADIGISDVFPTTCGTLPGGLPSGVKDFFGPIESYSFVVPIQSKEKSISMEAAYSVFGFGADSEVAPWTDPASIFIRDKDSGTQQMMGVAIGVPADRWMGTPTTSSTDMVTQLSMTMPPDKGIGILTSEVASANSVNVRTLAYQAKDQLCGYYPDSTPTSNDRRNVRDGHYWMWGPLHVLSQVGMNGYALKTEAQDIIGYITGTKDPPLGLDLISLLAKTGIVPACAMHVARDAELGPLMSVQPGGACGCYFEVAATGDTDCQGCVSSVECPAERPYCNHGYCEYK